MQKLKVFIVVLLLQFSVLYAQEKPYTTYKVTKGETLYGLTKKFNIDKNELLRLNPDIRNNAVKVDQVIVIPNKNFKPVPDVNKGDYIKDGFVYHKVLPKENYFRLRKKYGVSKKTLRKYNDILKYDDLKAGQIIRVPQKAGYDVDEEKATKPDKKKKPYLVKSKETKLMIARRYGITVEELEEINPEIKNGLKAITIILVPNTKEIPSEDDKFLVHQLEKGDNLFRLSQKFDISRDQLIETNPFLEDGVKVGAVIKIPKEPKMDVDAKLDDRSLAGKSLNIAIMLPFTNGKKLDFEKDRTLNIVTDFYLGAIMALDSIKKHGLSVNVNVIDNKNSKTAIANAVKTRNFIDLDAVIGPLFTNNVKYLTQYLNRTDVAVISPVSSQSHTTFATRNLVQDTPTEWILRNSMLNYIKETYNGENLVVFTDEIAENKANFDQLISDLNAMDSLKEVAVLTPEEGYIKPELFRKNIKKKKENWFVILTKDPNVTADVVQNLGVMSKQDSITLFSLYNTEDLEKLQNQHLARVNYHYPAANFINYENKKVQQFINKYKTKNYIEPSEFAFKGFDVTYDALVRLAIFKFPDFAFANGVTQRLSSKFAYNKDNTGSFVNKGVYIIKYNGLKRVAVKQNSSPEKTVGKN